ncbi:hypothetical protein ALP84_200097 [Pseudomonas cichorii]|uniref:Uncharacterized protein n=1 Tax=Pseudomonas cichorii TaxID=36746 RepID=A0A3M4WEA0_PSECI|nr:hypothetical protein ALP84_200097 [Pseudomonas cichorii]
MRLIVAIWPKRCSIGLRVIEIGFYGSCVQETCGSAGRSLPVRQRHPYRLATKAATPHQEKRS